MGCRQLWVTNQRDADRVTQSLARQGYNVYFGVNPRSRRGGTRADVLCAIAAYIDFDIVGGCLSSGAKPSVTVNSGNGYHHYWVYEEPLYDLELAEQINAGLALRHDADACWDCTRVLRVPATDNLPNKKKRKRGLKRKKTYVVRSREKDFDSLVMGFMYPAPERPEEIHCSLPGTEEWTPLTEKELSAFLPFQINPEPEDRSGADWCVVCTMLKHGATELDMARFLWNTPYGKGREKGPGYVRRTIENAIAEQRFFERIKFS